MEGLAATIDEMRTAVVRALPSALAASGRVVAAYAKANHPYQNRTFKLQTNTEYQFTSGSFEGGYTIRVDGGMPYGSFVENGTYRSRPYPFMAPAWVAMAPTSAQIVEATLLGALERLS